MMVRSTAAKRAVQTALNMCITAVMALFIGISPINAAIPNSSVKTNAEPISTDWRSKLGNSIEAIRASAHSATVNFNNYYRNHREQVVSLSQTATWVRGNSLIGTISFLVFLVVNLGLWASRISTYFKRIIERDAIPWAKRFGIRLEDLQNARAVMLFFLLFFLYQVVSFFLTRWNNSSVAFYADLAFDTLALGMLFTSYRRLTSGLRQRWSQSEEKQTRLNIYLREKLGEVEATLPHMLKLAGSTFAATYTPLVLANLPQILDGIVKFDRALT